jgi:hypothetical protein
LWYWRLNHGLMHVRQTLNHWTTSLALIDHSYYCFFFLVHCLKSHSLHCRSSLLS